MNELEKKTDKLIRNMQNDHQSKMEKYEEKINSIYARWGELQKEAMQTYADLLHDRALINLKIDKINTIISELDKRPNP